MQDTNGKAIKLKGKPGEFKAEDFTTGRFATAEDKAAWANKFTKFVLGGFQQGSFKKDIYRQLRNMFGHCAEYDIHGFYRTWFSTTKRCFNWVEHIISSWLTGTGDPRFTWSDVEKKLVQWIQDNDIRDQVAGYLQAETEAKERATLAALQSQYGLVPIASIAEEIGKPTSDSTLTKIEIPAPTPEFGQMTLF